ncbi:MAG: hypothetical protein LBU32_01305 [Clostridiales bacterium]|jgi:hypothetical protein|nr:hypothetical protein [Clostridiales bacterium]
MRFSLREEDINEAIKLSDDVISQLQSIINNLRNSMYDLVEAIRYKAMLDVCNLCLNYACNSVEDGLKLQFNEWMEQSLSFSYIAKAMHAGSGAVEVAESYEQLLRDSMIGILINPEDISVPTERPTMEQEKIKQLEDIIDTLIIGTEEIESQAVLKITELKENNLLFISLDTLFKSQFTSFKESFEYLRNVTPVILEKFDEMNRKVNALTESSINEFSNLAKASSESALNELGVSYDTSNSLEASGSSDGALSTETAGGMTKASQAGSDAALIDNANAATEKVLEEFSSPKDIEKLNNEIETFLQTPNNNGDISTKDKFKKLGSLLSGGFKKSLAYARNCKPETKKLILAGIGTAVGALASGAIPGAWVLPLKSILENIKLSSALKDFANAQIGLSGSDANSGDDKSEKSTQDKVKSFMNDKIEKLGSEIINDVFSPNASNPIAKNLVQEGNSKDLALAKEQILRTQQADNNALNRVREMIPKLPEKFREYADKAPVSQLLTDTPAKKHIAADEAVRQVCDNYKSDRDLQQLYDEIEQFSNNYPPDKIKTGAVPTRSDFPKLFDFFAAAIKKVSSSLRDFIEIGELITILVMGATGIQIPVVLLIELAKSLKAFRLKDSIGRQLQGGSPEANMQSFVQNEIQGLADHISDEILHQQGGFADFVPLTEAQQKSAQKQFSNTKKNDQTPTTYQKRHSFRPDTHYEYIKKVTPTLNETSPVVSQLMSVAEASDNNLQGELDALKSFANENPGCAYDVSEKSDLGKLLKSASQDLPAPNNLFSSGNLNAEKLSRALCCVDLDELKSSKSPKSAKRQLDALRTNIMSELNGYPSIDEKGLPCADNINQVANAVDGGMKDFFVKGELGEIIRKCMNVPARTPTFASISLALLAIAAIPAGIALTPLTGGLSLPVSGIIMEAAAVCSVSTEKATKEENRLLNALVVSIGRESSEKLLRNYKIKDANKNNTDEGVWLTRKKC